MKKRNKTLASDNEDKKEDRSKKNIYTNVQRKLETIPSSKDLELCLEVEMDDEVRELIKYPEKSPSTLLDVTVIKPKGIDNLYVTEKQTLNANLVKKMITSMKIDSKEKTNLLQKIFGDLKNGDRLEKPVEDTGSRKSCLSSKNKKSPHKGRSIKFDQGDIQSATERISKVYTVYSTQTSKPRVVVKERPNSVPRKQEQVYTTPKTYSNIRSMFQCTKDRECKREEPEHKIDRPCHCQNCAIVGILSDSQKIPFATEEIPEIKECIRRERKSQNPFRNKSVSFKHFSEPHQSPSPPPQDHSECETIFKQLTNRIKDLEERVRLQEEKAVPKDYFKKIITKLVNHLTKLTHYTTINEDRSSVKDTPHAYQPPVTNPRGKTVDSRFNKFYVNHCQLDASAPVKFPAEKEYDPKPCSSQDEEPVITVNVARNHDGMKHNMESERSSAHPYPPKYGESIPLNESFWKWGGEILKPGIDLKNKIAVLLEEALQNFKKSWERPTQEQRFHEDLQRFLEEVSKNLPTKSRERRQTRFAPIRESNSDSSTLNWHSKKSKQPLFSRFMSRRGRLPVPQTNVNVAYVNPEVTKWVDSQVSFRVQSSEDLRPKVEDETMKFYKLHFLKMIENSKTTDKFKLWQSIWNQALASGQTKSDSVAVQIPDPRDHRRLVKIDYTMREIEKLLTGVVGDGGSVKNHKRCI